MRFFVIDINNCERWFKVIENGFKYFFYVCFDKSDGWFMFMIEFVDFNSFV